MLHHSLDAPCSQAGRPSPRSGPEGGSGYRPADQRAAITGINAMAMGVYELPARSSERSQDTRSRAVWCSRSAPTCGSPRRPGGLTEVKVVVSGKRGYRRRGGRARAERGAVARARQPARRREECLRLGVFDEVQHPSRSCRGRSSSPPSSRTCRLTSTPARRARCAATRLRAAVAEEPLLAGWVS